jgi:hypothetical protein
MAGYVSVEGQIFAKAEEKGIPRDTILKKNNEFVERIASGDYDNFTDDYTDYLTELWLWQAFCKYLESLRYVPANFTSPQRPIPGNSPRERT